MTSDEKSLKHDQIELVIKDSQSESHSKSHSDGGEEVIETTNNSPVKKVNTGKDQVEYTGGEKFDSDITPRKKYNIRPQKQTNLHNSLPKGIQDSSYFDMNDQRRSLLKYPIPDETLEEKQAVEKVGPFNDCDVNLDTEYDF